MRAPPNRHHILLGKQPSWTARERTKRKKRKFGCASASSEHHRCHSCSCRRGAFVRAPPKRHNFMLGPQQLGTARKRQRSLFCVACADSGDNRCHKHHHKQTSLLRAPPKRHHILLGQQRLGTARKRTERKQCQIFGACAGCRHLRCHSHHHKRISFLRAPPRQHNFMLGPQQLGTARKRTRRKQCHIFGACAGFWHNRCHSHHRRCRAFLRAPPRRHHILLGKQQLGTARKRTRRR